MTETALVTGSSRGIGRAIALRLARDGFDVVVHCRDRRDAADAVRREIAALGRGCRVLQFDVSDRVATTTALLADIAEHGCYHGVVCNAGIARDNSFPAMSGPESQENQVLGQVTPTKSGGDPCIGCVAMCPARCLRNDA